VKAPHKTGPGGWGPHHHQPGKGPKPPAPPKPKPPHHKKPPKPKPAPKPQKTHAHKKPRKLSPGYDVACCSAEALGLLLGWGADEVLALYWRTATDPDAGASILDTLQASCRSERFELSWSQCDETLHQGGCNPWENPLWPLRARLDSLPLILGVTLPEPHAIAVTPDGTWWSWSHPFNPDDWPELVVEEVWCLR